ncbi:MAG: polysaccharide deacetylase family protein [Propionivibrio sp.]|nr:polysaccharide deacetylase family protein [Propionivibrio sp.]
MNRIALKIDVDTYKGTLHGVPALIELLQRYDAGATFFFSLGPDQSGCETRTTSLSRYYDLRTRLYGRIFPSPNIGVRCAEIMQQVGSAGFEVGIHAWNRVLWEKSIQQAENPWVEGEIAKACIRFEELFGGVPRVHAAAGWRMNRHALRLTQRLGFSYASDCRGSHPFIPVIDGEIIGCPQIPTTLPTLDELLVLEPKYSVDQAVDRIAQLSRAISGDHVFTLRAELEGMKFIEAFERLLATWKSNNQLLVPLRDIRTEIDPGRLPRHTVSMEDTPGRKGARLTQGNAFLWPHGTAV